MQGLDVGCGYGFWGFIIKTYLNGFPVSSSIVVGLDIDLEKITLAKRHGLYDDVVLADANSLPIRPKSIDTVIAVEVYSSESLQRSIMEIDGVTRDGASIFLAIPSGESSTSSLLLERGYSPYLVRFRGLILINESNGKAFLLWNTFKAKFVSYVMRFSWRLSKALGKGRGYTLALKGIDLLRHSKVK